MGDQARRHFRLTFPEPDELFGIRIGKRFDEDSANGAKKRSSGADPEREHEDKQYGE
jgi:hypothetical protein